MSLPRKIKDIVEKMIDQFSPIAEVILLEGSWAYGGTNSLSDLDFEIVIKNFQLLRSLKPKGEFCSLIKGVLNCLKVIDNSEGIDLIQAKRPVFGVPIGVRVLELKTFQTTSQVNLLTLNKDLFLLSVRDKERKGQSLVYTQRNFEGRIKKFDKKFWVVLGKQFTLVPVFLFDQVGHFYPGSMVDRYLCSPKILFDRKGKGQKILKEIKADVVRRYFMEKERFGFSKGTGVFRCLSRWEKLPVEVKEELLGEEKQLKRLFQPAIHGRT